MLHSVSEVVTNIVNGTEGLPYVSVEKQRNAAVNAVLERGNYSFSGERLLERCLFHGAVFLQVILHGEFARGILRAYIAHRAKDRAFRSPGPVEAPEAPENAAVGIGV